VPVVVVLSTVVVLVANEDVTPLDAAVPMLEGRVANVVADETDAVLKTAVETEPPDPPTAALEGADTYIVVVVIVSSVVVIVKNGRTLGNPGRVTVVVTPLVTVTTTFWAAMRGRNGRRARPLKCILERIDMISELIITKRLQFNASSMQSERRTQRQIYSQSVLGNSNLLIHHRPRCHHQPRHLIIGDICSSASPIFKAESPVIPVTVPIHVTLAQRRTKYRDVHLASWSAQQVQRWCKSLIRSRRDTFHHRLALAARCSYVAGALPQTQ
jgi:hypothetical protein